MDLLTEDQEELYSRTVRMLPIVWISKVLGISKFSAGQADILQAIPEAIAKNKPIVVPSANSQGKDFLASCISLWFLYNYQPSKVIFTAPTDRQVKEIMWAELQSRWNNAKIPLPGRTITCKVDIEPNWFMLGFTTKESAGSIGKAQGFHSENICVIISEAQAVENSIFDQFDSILTATNNLQILIGNPLATTGRFASSIKNTTDNIVIRLDALDSPNVLEKKIVIPGMASHEWVEKMRKRYDPEGTGDHPIWMARVRGLLPHSAIDAVFSIDLVDKGVSQVPLQRNRKIATSCDPARMGDDDCVIYGGISGRIVEEDIQAQSRADSVCSRVLQVNKKIGGNHILCEADGLGGPICDFLRKLKPDNVYLQEVYMNGAAEDSEHYANMRAQMYFYAKEQVEQGKEQIPDDEYLKQELVATKYFYNIKTGKIQLIPKEDIKDDIGRSPNRADAWVMNVWARKSSAVVRKPNSWNDQKSSGEISSRVRSAMAA